jgi:hypothetical protein
VPTGLVKGEEVSVSGDENASSGASREGDVVVGVWLAAYARRV